jgi:hypothetical protein
MKVLLHPGLSGIEQSLISMLLAGDDSILAGLRAQFAEARLVERELTGSGFFLKFAVRSGATQVEPPDITIDDVLFDLEGLEHGGGAIAHVSDGYLDLIEAYLKAESWPANPTPMRIYYDTGDPRDLALLGKVWRDRRGKVAP